MDTRAICIIGPTGIGKTNVAFSLAKKLNGEVVNLDKIYTYKYFSVSTGLSDGLREKNVKKHLYQLIEPDRNIIAPQKFVKMVRATCLDIENRGKQPIIEGGSTTYFPALYKLNKKAQFIKKIIYLKFPKDYNVAGKIEKRLNLVMQEGLLEEVKMGIKRYPDSLIMNDCHFVVPIVQFLKGKIDLKEARYKVVQRCLTYIQKQKRCFELFPDIFLLEHNPDNPKATIKKMETLKN